MAEIKIEWSYEAEIDLFEIMEFYSIRNGNSIYSEKIYHNIFYN